MAKGNYHKVRPEKYTVYCPFNSLKRWVKHFPKEESQYKTHPCLVTATQSQFQLIHSAHVGQGVLDTLNTSGELCDNLVDKVLIKRRYPFNQD